MNSPIKSNKLLWDSLADLHIDDPWYRLDDFLHGGSSLNAPEMDLLGSVADSTLLHLQCHIGLDSMSLHRMGAKVTGVDFSDKALTKARQLAATLQLDCHFHLAEISQLAQSLEGDFDIVYTSYGVLDWLPSLKTWAEVVSHFLKPGGRFVMVEFHPILAAFDLETSTWKYPYFNAGEPVREIMSHSYTGRELEQTHEMFLWSHSLSEIMSVLLEEGLRLDRFEEYDYSPYQCFPNLHQRAPNEWVWTEGELPLLVGMSWSKNG